MTVAIFLPRLFHSFRRTFSASRKLLGLLPQRLKDPALGQAFGGDVLSSRETGQKFIVLAR